MENHPVSKEEHVRWVNENTTQKYLTALHQTREELKEGIAQGQATDEKEMYIAIGRCQGLEDALKAALKDFPVVENKDQDDDIN